LIVFDFGSLVVGLLVGWLVCTLKKWVKPSKTQGKTQVKPAINYTTSVQEILEVREIVVKNG
jgi:fructose-specific phosphotransferase system IIC component